MRDAPAQQPSQWTLFLTALEFYTRIPMPKSFVFSKDALNRCNRYFPLVGWVVALTSAGTFWLLARVLPQGLAVLPAVAAGILLTGAFHEDGLADFFDGFGGGWDKAKILSIMKDSRLGTYGAIAMVVALALKVVSLYYMPKQLVFLSLLVAHPLSRLLALTFMGVLPYARVDGKSKSVGTAMGVSDWFIAATTGLGPFLLMLAFASENDVPQHQILAFFMTTLAGYLALHVYLKNLMKRWIDGYTGDCLGAAQQLAEVLFFLLSLGFLGSL